MKNYKNTKDEKRFSKNKSNNYSVNKSKPRENKPYSRENKNTAKENSKYNRETIDTELEKLQLEGRNPVLEAINNNKTIDKIIVKKGEIEGSLKVIVAKAIEKGIIVQEVNRQKMDEISQSHNHQGIIAMCPAHEYVEVEDIIQSAKNKNEAPFIIILDEITDPHNLGAILRTADACGAHGVILPKRRAVGLTGVVSKTSAGAVEYVPVARVTNISNTIEDLKKQGIWITCADTDGKVYYNSNLKGALAIVIGNEGQGVGRLIKEKCDFNIKIPMYGQISSLNASVAASLVMYEVVRQRKF